MTYTEKVKNEISSEKLNEMENRYLLLGYMYVNASFQNNKVLIHLENLGTARKLFRTIKYCYHVIPKIIVRKQKKFRMKNILILEISDNKNFISDELKNLLLIEKEEKQSFIKGVFFQGSLKILLT